MIRKALWVGMGTGAMVALVVACKPAAKSGASTKGSPVKAASVGGFQTPESVKWDSTRDVYFVSNVNGAPSAKDGNGYITRLGPAGMVMDSAFIKGLNAPKGMALVHDTLWVADIDQVRAFEARTGAPVATIPLPGAIFLNDIAAAPDGSLYVTDTAIRFGANRIFAWKPGETTTTTLGTGAGQFDGVEITKDGAVWVSSWADSSVYRYAGGQGAKLVKGVPSPADIGYDARRNRLLVPIFSGNRVEIWQLQ